jgi:hypothetical protein
MKNIFENVKVVMYVPIVLHTQVGVKQQCAINLPQMLLDLINWFSASKKTG